MASSLIDPPFQLFLPDRPEAGVVFASPHSGRDYPADLLRRTTLDALRLRSSEDAFVDLLLRSAPGFGAPLIAGRVPRAFVDLNRGADELDPALIEGVRPRLLNPRVAAGLGVIPRVVSGGRAIYSGKIPLAEAEARIAGYWRPYHDRLAALMEAAMRRFGQAVLIDMHSMPHEALDGLGPDRPEVVLGDRYGTSAAPGVIAQIEAAFLAEGFRVRRNAPFAGAYVTQTYGCPARNCHAVQIEIDRALYMDEALVRPLPGFDAFEERLSRVLGRMVAGLRGTARLAAE